jgi:site-specific DNA-adenine methylase
MAYAGGKAGAGVYQTLINLMPPHRIYIEPFAGSGAVMRHKRPAQINIGVDLDARTIKYLHPEASPEIAMMPALSAATIQMTQSALDFLRSFNFQGDELVYSDPPYLMSVRQSKKPIYKFEMTSEAEHRELIEILLKLPCMVMLSGYRSDLYDQLLARWRRVDYQTTNRAGQRVTESVWLNFPEPAELHDYSHLGRGFRERERIKRKRKRWHDRIATMPALERHALLAAIQDATEQLKHRRL